jgi:hypothetical protein
MVLAITEWKQRAGAHASTWGDSIGGAVQGRAALGRDGGASAARHGYRSRRLGVYRPDTPDHHGPGIRLSEWSRDVLARPEALQVAFCDWPLAPEQWNVYERTARSYACTREFSEYFEQSAGASLGLVRSSPGGEERAAFLFRVTADGAALVLGRFAAPTADALAAFASAVFERHPRVGRIETKLMDALPEPGRVGRPVLVVGEAVELRITLPASVAEYEASLAKDFVTRIRYHERRLARDLPSARFATLERAEIPRSWIADVIELNRRRMASKNMESVFSERYEEGIARVVREHGCVTVLLDGSRVCAGVVDVHCGPEAFGWVIGHDDAYGKHRPGRLCQLMAIRHCIGRGIRTLHMLHGESPYKRDFGGQSAPLASYVVLRDWASARPTDVARVCQKHLLRFARHSLATGDRVAERVLGKRTALTSFARAVAHRARRISRSS